MNDKATKKVQAKAGKNSATIPWPVDPMGVNADLKKGGVKAAARVKGDKERLDNLLTCLRLIAEHARAKYDADVAARQEARENNLAARARVAESQAKAAEAQAQALEDAAARLRAQNGIKPTDKSDEGDTE